MSTLAICTALLSLGVAALLPLAAARTGKPRDIAIGATFAVLVLAVSGFLAASGALRDFSKTPPALLRLVPALTVATVAVALSPFGARVARAVPLCKLVGFQSFRILVELLLWALYRQGAIPVQMTFEGRNLDILTGVLAVPLGVALLVTRAPSRLLSALTWAWNLLGLATLLNIVIIAVLSMPTPFRAFQNGLPNTLVAELPYVWIPCLFVQAALMGHVLTFRALWQRRSSVAMMPQRA